MGFLHYLAMPYPWAIWICIAFAGLGCYFGLRFYREISWREVKFNG
jgi:hypothetical protein